MIYLDIIDIALIIDNRKNKIINTLISNRWYVLENYDSSLSICVDISTLSKNMTKEHFSEIYNTCLKENHIYDGSHFYFNLTDEELLYLALNDISVAK